MSRIYSQNTRSYTTSSSNNKSIPPSETKTDSDPANRVRTGRVRREKGRRNSWQFNQMALGERRRGMHPPLAFCFPVFINVVRLITPKGLFLYPQTQLIWYISCKLTLQNSNMSKFWTVYSLHHSSDTSDSQGKVDLCKGSLSVSLSHGFNSNIKQIVVLHLIVVKPEFIKELRDLEVNEGDPARLKCKLKASPKPTIEWLVDDDRIRESRRIQFEFDGENAVLFITATNPEDEGEYTCKASNLAGTELTRAELIVNGKWLSIVKMTDFGQDIFESDVKTIRPVRC